MLPFHRRFIPSMMILAVLAATGAHDAFADDNAAAVEQLIEQLNADEAVQRDEAEKKLVELGLQGGAAAGESFLDQLPKPHDRMPQEVQARLARVASQIRSRLAKQAIEGTRVSLDVTDAPLAEVLADIEKQTGNRLTDYREQFGQQSGEKKLTLKVEDEPFWAATDKMLDALQMSPYLFSGEETLALIDREPGVLRRFGRAKYSGPFRVEATNVTAQRGVRSPEQSFLRVDLEISWEPRLKPIALTQAAGDMKAVCDDGRETPATSEDAVFDIEVEPGSHAAEVTIPLQLPAREATTLTSLTGKFTALVPSRIVDLKFEDLVNAKDQTQQAGGVNVTLDRVVKNQALWEIHMRVRLDSLEGGLESHRGWVFQNVTFLVDKEGEQLDNAGFETTMQTETEAGFAYFFELLEGRELSDYAWVYRTPASIVTVPVEYKLEDVPLP